LRERLMSFNVYPDAAAAELLHLDHAERAALFAQFETAWRARPRIMSSKLLRFMRQLISMKGDITR
jgi:hypothetical protein